MKSLSEIDTVSKRSSRAAGYSWGIAEEIGKNIRLLEIFSLPGIKNLNDFLNKKKHIKLENLNLITKNNNANNIQYCPVIAGVNFLDQVRSLENLNEIKFQNIAFPILFLPFVSRASEVIGKKLELKIDNRAFLLNYNNSIYANSSNEDIIEIGNNVSIKFKENEDSFEESEWKELYKLSENTFVEESESSKVGGAGAELTDND